MRNVFTWLIDAPFALLLYIGRWAGARLEVRQLKRRRERALRTFPIGAKVLFREKSWVVLRWNDDPGDFYIKPASGEKDGAYAYPEALSRMP